MNENLIQALFSFLSFSPGPFWLILIFAPRKRIAMLCFDTYLLLVECYFYYFSIPRYSRAAACDTTESTL
jgi:hypothetical protein